MGLASVRLGREGNGGGIGQGFPLEKPLRRLFPLESRLLGGILGELLECNRSGTLLFELLTTFGLWGGRSAVSIRFRLLWGADASSFFQVWMVKCTCGTRILLIVTFTPVLDLLPLTTPTSYLATIMSDTEEREQAQRPECQHKHFFSCPRLCF